jgi:sterol desaturase/sphingolipid hydroxylase (fatty acid hydroxylase superfamily)
MTQTAGLALRISQNNTWVLIGLFALLAGLETVAPRRKLLLSTVRRWTLHSLLYLATGLFFRLIFGAGTVALAMVASGNPHTLLARLGMPYALRFAIWIPGIDLLRYAQHRLLHSVSWLWRIHLLHHSDRDFDFTNEFRFHPLEAVLTRAASLAAIVLLGPPPLAVAVDELLGIIFGMLEHANFKFPGTAERILRHVVITPELHRVHHSLDEHEQYRNLGTVFVWWDRIFGTYQEIPARGFDAMEFGVEEVGPAECIHPLHMLAAPFGSSRRSAVSVAGRTSAVRGIGVRRVD